MNANTIKAAELTAELERLPRPRSHWGRAVKAAAIELVEDTASGYNTAELPADPAELEQKLLNGAKDWHQFSWGGNWHCYDADIAAAFCSPSELKKTDNGNRRPNSRESWLDVQARALFQAANLITNAARAINARNANAATIAA